MIVAEIGSTEYIHREYSDKTQGDYGDIGLILKPDMVSEYKKLNAGNTITVFKGDLSTILDEEDRVYLAMKYPELFDDAK